jgi:hypothetical protein
MQQTGRTAQTERDVAAPQYKLAYKLCQPAVLVIPTQAQRHETTVLSQTQKLWYMQCAQQTCLKPCSLLGKNQPNVVHARISHACLHCA